VFVGGCTLEAAEAVCNVDDLPIEVVDGVAALLDKSLVRQTEGPDGEPRFTMLETIREYAQERLEASGEVEIVRQRDMAYYVALAEAVEPKLYGPEIKLWLDRLDQERDNLRAALRWALERNETELVLRLGAALGWFWFVRGGEREGLQCLEAALTQTSTDRTPARAWALWHAGRLAGGNDRAHAQLEESLVLFRELGDKRGTTRALGSLGFAELVQGNNERAQALLAEHVALAQEFGDTASLADAMNSRLMLAQQRGDDGALLPLAAEHVALRRQVGDPQSLCWALKDLGETARLLGEDDRAIAAYEEGLGLARELSSWGFVATILSNLGFVVQRQGDQARAAMLFGESLAVSQEWAFEDVMAWALTGLAGVAAAQSQSQRAARLLGTVEAWNVQLEAADRADYDRIVAAARTQLGEEAFAAAWAAGRSMSLEQAVAEALGDGDSASRSW
jgi:tetratricopeptide (TPR) repeat protein